MCLSKHNIQTRTLRRLAYSVVALNPEETARFWRRVAQRDAAECWLWTASVSGSGSVQHGQFTVRRDGHQIHYKAHRIAWTLLRGPIPEGLQVCHHCDVPRCCNPAHLFLGTQDDNIKDAARKHRFHRPRTRVLSLADRLWIHGLPEERGLGVRLARQYGVNESTISHIRAGRFVGASEPHTRPAADMPSAPQAAALRMASADGVPAR